MRDCLKIILGKEELWLSSRRCLWWPTAQTLIVADLHLGKGISFCDNAKLLPPYDTIDTLIRLRQLVKETRAQRVICLGDNFHRRHSFLALGELERKMINDLSALVSEWVWIMGNHDPDLPTELGGVKTRGMNDGYLGFYHQPSADSLAELQLIGHFHPKYMTMVQRHRISKPCFAWNQKILIMPSFGSYTGGLTLQHPEILKVLGKSFYLATADTWPKPILIEKK